MTPFDPATLMNALYVAGVMLIALLDVFSDPEEDEPNGSDYSDFEFVPLDPFIGSDSADNVLADSTAPRVYELGDGDDTLTAGDGDDEIRAEEGDDEVYGGGGDDRAIMGAGNDVFRGGAGNDSVTGSSGNDTLWGGAGNDLLRGGAQDDRLSGDEGDDVLLGDEGDDLIMGGSGNDTLSGGTGVDTLEGQDGDDELHLGAGDEGTGGAGMDKFTIDMDVPAEDRGIAYITDFDPEDDQIVIEYDANTDPGDLTIARTEDGTGSIISLGDVAMAKVTSVAEIDPDSIVLQGV